MMTRAPASPESLCIHVSPTGDDRGPGTPDGPLRSLEAARDAVRHIRQSRSAAITVWFHGGVYRREKSFRLTKCDSGRREAPVTYRAFGDGPAVLSGAVAVEREDFVPLTDPECRARIVSKAAREGVLCLDLKRYGFGPRDGLRRHGFLLPLPLPPAELFVGGRPMRRSRWPKNGYLQTGPAQKDWIGRRFESRLFSLAKRGPLENFFARLRVRNAFLLPGAGGSFRCDCDRLRLWQQAEELWVDGIFSEDWAWSYNRVAALDTKNGTVTLADPEAYALRQQGGGRFFFDNLLEEIAVPGEIYMDSKRACLYLLPPARFWHDGTDIALSRLSAPIISLNDVSHLSFEGLTLERGRDIAIEARGGRNIGIRDCEIRHFGRGGLRLEGASHRTERCHIHHVGGPAVRLAGGNLEDLTPGALAITDSRIHDWGRWQKVYAPAVELDGVGHRLSNCHLHRGPHVAVTVNGNDHVIEDNEIDDTVRDFRDMGAIYIDLGREPLQRGTCVRGNHIHHLANPLGRVYGVYVDRCTMGLSIEDNVFQAIGSLGCPDAKAVGGNGFAYVSVRGNLFLDCTVPFELAFYLQDWGRRDLAELQRAWRRRLGRGIPKAMPHAARYPELEIFFAEDRCLPDSNRFVGNLVVNQSVPRVHKGTIRVLYGPAALVHQADNWIVPAAQRHEVLEVHGGRIELDPAVFRRIPGFAAPDLAKAGPQS